MDKPMLVFKRFGHQIHLMVQKEANVVVLNLWVGLKVRLCVFWIIVRKIKTWS